MNNLLTHLATLKRNALTIAKSQQDPEKRSAYCKEIERAHAIIYHDIFKNPDGYLDHHAVTLAFAEKIPEDFDSLHQDNPREDEECEPCDS